MTEALRRLLKLHTRKRHKVSFPKDTTEWGEYILNKDLLTWSCCRHLILP